MHTGFVCVQVLSSKLQVNLFILHLKSRNAAVVVAHNIKFHDINSDIKNCMLRHYTIEIIYKQVHAVSLLFHCCDLPADDFVVKTTREKVW